MDEKEWMNRCLSLREKYPILESEFNKRKGAGKIGVIAGGGKGNIPVIYANGENLPEAWENSLIALWNKGIFVRTQYDRKEKEGYIDPPSKDCTMVMVIEKPLTEPRIHRDFPGGIDALEEYRQEVVEGVKDSWIRDPNNPKDERWEYTYHDRIFNYEIPGLEKAIDQFEAMAKNLAKSPITRRAQMSTWKVWEDINIGDPACMQSIWGRILREHPDASLEFYSDETTGKPTLNLNWRFRSRDAYGAAFMNDYAIIFLGKKLADRISELRNEEIQLGKVVDISDSYHIYGKDFQQFLGRFAKGLETRHFLEDHALLQEGRSDMKARTWRTDSPGIIDTIEEAKKKIPLKIAEQNAKYAKK